MRNSKRVDKEIPPVDGTRLLKLFETYFERYEEKRDYIAEFILLLWKVRLKFDKYVIKWVTVDNKEVHAIGKLYLNDNTLHRRDQEGNSGFALLQSMLYHSQEIITHYWLTPFLYKMVEKDSSSVSFSSYRQVWLNLSSSLYNVVIDLDRVKGSLGHMFIFCPLL